MSVEANHALKPNSGSFPVLPRCENCKASQPCPTCLISYYLSLCQAFGAKADPSVSSAIMTGWDLMQVVARNPTDPSLIPLVVSIPYLDGLRTLLIGTHATVSQRGDGNWICRSLAGGLQKLESLRVLDLQRLGIDGRGLRELSPTICALPNLKELILRYNYLGQSGGTEALISIVKNAHISLRFIDVSCNSLGYFNVRKIERAATEARSAPPSLLILDDDTRITPSPNESPKDTPTRASALRKGCCSYEISVEGNFVVEEVWNSVLHGLGVILGLIGTWDLLSKAKGQSDRVFWACFVYGLSATTLFTASTLYHSTFLHERARRVFQILDHCAIFILIAGTYTPIGLIGLSNVPEAVAMVIMEWLIALVGITIYCVSAHIPRLVESFPYIIYEVVLYLVMGQMCLFSYEQIIVPLSKDLLFTLLLGGGIYIVGVIFFVLEQVKRIPIMHCVWHIFVLAAAIVHFFSVRSAVVNHLYETAHSEAAIAASKPWLSELAKFPQFRDL